jgi:hypothetical protein
MLGEMSAVIYLMKLTAADGALVAAAQAGQLHVVKHLAGRVPPELPDAIAKASRNGHRNVVKYLYSLRYDQVDYDLCANECYRGGHLDILQFFLDRELSQIDVKHVFYRAVDDNRDDVVDLLVQYNLDEVPTALERAILEGSVAVLPVLLNHHPHNVTDCLIAALHLGRDKMIELLATQADVEKAFRSCYEEMNLEICTELLKHADLRELIKDAIVEDNIKLVRFICENGYLRTALVRELHHWSKRMGYAQSARYLREIL